MKFVLRSTSARVWLALCAVVAFVPAAQAFDLSQLSQQLREPTVIRGDFVQQKQLRALPQPLVSHGQFVLAREQGLLWFVRQPLQQDYRITDAGIQQRTFSGWAPAGQEGAAGRQNRLFLALLRGDTDALQRDFELELLGTAEAWSLTLTPRSKLLEQIFTAIQIQGGATAERVELLETQGDSTLLLLESTEVDDQLSPVEQHDFTY